MKNPEAIAEIREYPPTQILFRVVCVAWVAFAMYKFSINPVFFGISILAALTVFLLITRMVITVTENAVSIEHQRILPILPPPSGYSRSRGLHNLIKNYVNRRAAK